MQQRITAEVGSACMRAGHDVTVEGDEDSKEDKGEERELGSNE